MTKPRKPRPAEDSRAWLYLVGFAAHSGRLPTVKVGVTGSPKKRMADHGAYHGVDWRHFSASGTRALMLEAERRVVLAFAEVGTCFRGEEFFGLERGQAIQIVRAVVEHVRERAPEILARRAGHVANLREWRAYKAALRAA